MKKQFELSIDHAMLKTAKLALDNCLNLMISKAITTGSMEGKASLTISVEIVEAADNLTGEIQRIPEIKFKAGYSVPIKQSVDGKIVEQSSLLPKPEGGWALINGQVSMEELLSEQEDG